MSGSFVVIVSSIMLFITFVIMMVLVALFVTAVIKTVSSVRDDMYKVAGAYMGVGFAILFCMFIMSLPVYFLYDLIVSKLA